MYCTGEINMCHDKPPPPKKKLFALHKFENGGERMEGCWFFLVFFGFFLFFVFYCSNTVLTNGFGNLPGAWSTVISYTTCKNWGIV